MQRAISTKHISTLGEAGDRVMGPLKSAASSVGAICSLLHLHPILSMLVVFASHEIFGSDL